MYLLNKNHIIEVVFVCSITTVERLADVKTYLGNQGLVLQRPRCNLGGFHLVVAGRVRQAR